VADTDVVVAVAVVTIPWQMYRLEPSVDAVVAEPVEPPKKR
jgi:hypothetical protein